MYHFKVWSLRSGQAGQLTTVALTLTGLSMHACMHVTHLQGMYIDVLLLHSIMITVTFHRLASDHSKTHFDLQTVHAPSAAFTTCSKWGDGRSLISIITNLRPVRSTIPCALIASACSCTHCTLVVADKAHIFHGICQAQVARQSTHGRTTAVLGQVAEAHCLLAFYGCGLPLMVAAR